MALGFCDLALLLYAPPFTAAGSCTRLEVGSQLHWLLCRSWRWHTRCHWQEPSSSWPLTVRLGSTCRGLIVQRSQRRAEAQLDIIHDGMSLATSLGSMHMYHSYVAAADPCVAWDGLRASACIQAGYLMA